MPELLTLIDPLTSCAVTAQATPNMTVAVAVGTVMVGNVVATVLPANVTIAAADATRDRVDAVVADSTGALSAIAGSTDDGFNARPPDTTGYALLAYVYVFSRAHASFTGTITSAMIDARLVGQQSVDARQLDGVHLGQRLDSVRRPRRRKVPTEQHDRRESRYPHLRELLLDVLVAGRPVHEADGLVPAARSRRRERQPLLPAPLVAEAAEQGARVQSDRLHR